MLLLPQLLLPSLPVVAVVAWTQRVVHLLVRLLLVLPAGTGRGGKVAPAPLRLLQPPLALLLLLGMARLQGAAWAHVHAFASAAELLLDVAVVAAMLLVAAPETPGLLLLLVLAVAALLVAPKATGLESPHTSCLALLSLLLLLPLLLHLHFPLLLLFLLLLLLLLSLQR
jgi:hypothetical protein